MPSVVEEIVTSDSFAFVLPPPIPDPLVDRLARRGKLTANFLDVLLDPKRVMQTVEIISQLRHVDSQRKICFETSKANIHRERRRLLQHFGPFRSVFASAFRELIACAKTLTSLSASFVTDDLGWSRSLVAVRSFEAPRRELHFYILSTTSCELNALTSLTLLKHLNISGTDLTWHQLCNFPCCDLRRLDMSSLRFLGTTERTLVFSPDFTTAWISRFF